MRKLHLSNETYLRNARPLESKPVAADWESAQVWPCVGGNAFASARNGFTVIFYGSAIFGCKAAEFCAMRREFDMAEIPSFRYGAQRSENKRKMLPLNYKSAALPAELCRHITR